jgi:uncharacterized protein YqjF (DUF2071 family)
MASKFLTAEWRKLALANYIVDPEILLPYLPYKTELDTWNGNHYLSLVGFRFINTRIKGIPVPFHRHFEEVNLRLYVRYKSSSGWKRGVTFIREIVPRRALTFVANSIFGEKYITMPMKHHWEVKDDLLLVSYSWQQNQKWNTFGLAADPSPSEILAGSEEDFITEHYWGYTSINESRCSEYGVEHPRWEHYKVREYKIDVDFSEVYGSRFDFLSAQTPASVMLAEGSEIVVRSSRRIA